MSEFAVPIGSELLLFMLTVVVGYVVLTVAYDYSQRLDEWRELQAFDKAILTFLTGGFVTVVSFLLSTWGMKEPPVFFDYIIQNATSIFLLDLFLVGPTLGLLIGRFLLAKANS